MEQSDLKSNKMTIAQTLEDINRVKFLPAIQRKFEWTDQQIERLFDSIMRNYPIGTFLYWRLKSEGVAEKYTFYDFIRNYRANFPYNEARRVFTEPEIVAVLDRQQRMSALYIGLSGSVSRRKKYAWGNKESSYEVKHLYFNALSDPMREIEESSNRYEFKMMTAEEVTASDGWEKFWVKVENVYAVRDFAVMMDWLREQDYVKQMRRRAEERGEPIEQADEKAKRIEKNLSRLAYKILADENVINYFEITSRTMDEVLDIFVRVNSGGKVLSKGDLLFSTIVCHWDEARDKVDELIREINETGQEFDFGVEEVIMGCLYLMDFSTTLKVDNLNAKRVEKIRSEWERIAEAILTTMEIVADLGYSRKNLTSKNVLLPLMYFVYKSEKTDFRADKAEMRKYLAIAQAKMIFRASTDTVLERLKSLMTESVQVDAGQSEVRQRLSLRRKEFRVEDLISEDYDDLKFTETDLGNVMKMKKGPVTFSILTMLDTGFLWGEKAFHQDHLFPHALLEEKKMRELGLAPEDAVRCEKLRDRLPNLQILEGRKNESKNKTEFKEWYDQYPQKQAIIALPEEKDGLYERKNFLKFYGEREKLLKRKLRKVFGLPLVVEDEKE